MLKGSILQQLWEAHQESCSLNLGVYYKNTLVALCHALEDGILQADYQPLVLTAFQRGQWYLQEADRYGQIASRAAQIVILAAPDTSFAEHPTSQRSSVNLVQLDLSDPVAQEWHLMIVSPDYMAMVLCQELSAADYGAAGLPQNDLERKFYGLWTFEPQLILESARLMVAHIDRYDEILHQRLVLQLGEIEAHAQSDRALCHQPTAEHLGAIVARVVDYLQASEQSQDKPPQEQPHHYQNSSTNLKTNLIVNELQAYLRLAELMDQTDLSNPMAAAEVTRLAEAIGQILDLPAWQISRLRLAGFLHRLAFLSQEHPRFSQASLQQAADLAGELSDVGCVLESGVQVLRKLGRLRAIATILAHQTEWWNGGGGPAGLGGDAIPIESRILSLVADFQCRLAQLRLQQEQATGKQPGFGLSQLQNSPEHSDGHSSELYPLALCNQALAGCRDAAGKRHDPQLLELLALLVNGLQEGLTLPTASSKAIAELWQLS